MAQPSTGGCDNREQVTRDRLFGSCSYCGRPISLTSRTCIAHRGIARNDPHDDRAVRQLDADLEAGLESTVLIAAPQHPREALPPANGTGA